MKRNGEAIYDTRPWYDGVPQSVTAEGIQARYTVKGDSLYVILFDRPGAVVTFAKLEAAAGMQVRMLGVDDEIEWKQTGRGLVLQHAADTEKATDAPEIPGKFAFVYQITPRPKWK